MSSFFIFLVMFLACGGPFLTMNRHSKVSFEKIICQTEIAPKSP